jgi:exodeoxyribonuclease VII small subunit
MTKPIHFEKSMAELQDIVMQLEKGELPLEDSLKQFEQGITIARQCQDILNQAEQKIEMLSAVKAPPHDDIADE